MSPTDFSRLPRTISLQGTAPPGLLILDIDKLIVMASEDYGNGGPSSVQMDVPHHLANTARGDRSALEYINNEFFDGLHALLFTYCHHADPPIE